jgi:hypothetical protein
MAAVQWSSELVWKGSLSAAQQCTRRERVDRVGLADQQTLDPAIPRLSLPRTKAIKQPLQLNRPGVPYVITRVSLDARLGRHPERFPGLLNIGIARQRLLAPYHVAPCGNARDTTLHTSVLNHRAGSS